MALRSLSTAALRAELARREKGAAKLQRKHGKLAKALAALERTLLDLGVGAMGLGGGNVARRGRPPGSKNKKRRGKRRGRPPGSKTTRKAGRTRAKNKQSLGDALAAAVRPGTVVSPAQAMAKVKAAGYKSSAQKFGIVVALRLANDKRFKRKGRGQYLRIAG